MARTVLRGDRRGNPPVLPGDAVSAARAALSGRAAGAPKGRDGQVEAIRALMVAKRTARSERIQTINQARSLIVTGPEDLRARFACHSADDLAAELAPAAWSATTPCCPCASWGGAWSSSTASCSASIN